jgi:hypothetical protein
MKIIVLLALLLGIVCPIQAEESEKLSSENRALIHKKRLVIEKEIAKLKNHPWAGNYYHGDGLGANVTLALAPENGFTITWNGCMGLYDQNHGSVTWDGDSVKLSFAFKLEDAGIGNYASEYKPIRWGRRVYMIPVDGIIDFANYVNFHMEPRDEMQGSFFLRMGDEKKKISGKPELPEKYMPYLLNQPVNAVVTSTKDARKNDGLESVTIIIDKGGKDGLLPGMTLHITEPDNVYNIGNLVELIDVGEAQAEGKFRYDPSKSQTPEAGWQLSTCPSWVCGMKK